MERGVGVEARAQLPEARTRGLTGLPVLSTYPSGKAPFIAPACISSHQVVKRQNGD
jgi:hypothetical protein